MNGLTELKPATRAATTLGERIKAIRLNWRWSQGELAHALRVDQASISYWERGKVKPSGSGLVALASLFRTSAEAMEEGTGFQMPEPPCRPEAAKADREDPRGVSLPWGGKDVVMLIDLIDGSSNDSGLSEAMMSLVQAFKENRRAWVVLE